MIIPYNKNITKQKNNYYITTPITVYQICPKFSTKEYTGLGPWKKLEKKEILMGPNYFGLLCT